MQISDNVVDGLARRFGASIEGVTFGGVASGADMVRVTMVIGDAVGRDIIYWTAPVDIDRERFDQAAMLQRIERPIAALRRLLDDAEARGYAKGKAEGQKASLAALNAAVAAFGKAVADK